MARPRLYDDTQLLEIMADLIVSGEVKTNAEAQRRAVAFIWRSEHWAEHIRKQLFDRLFKAYVQQRTKLEQDAKDRIYQRKDMTWLPKFLPPTLLMSPRDPALQYQSSEARELEVGLRDVATWATDLANLLRRQSSRGEINRDLVDQARELVNLAQKERSKREQKNSAH